MSNMRTKDTAVRNHIGQFKEGHSGNPSGRPKSEISKIRSELANHSGEIIAVVVGAAKKGDLQACKLILDRLSPPLKAQSPEVYVSIPESASLSEIAQHFINAAAIGSLCPDSATQLITAVGTLARITEISELKARVEGLEVAIKERRQ